MTAVFIIIVVLGTLILNILLARKIPAKTFRIGMEIANATIAFVLAVLFVFASFANSYLKAFFGQQTERVESTVNRIYPGAFEQSFSTVELKEILRSSLESESKGSAVETIAVNLVKLKLNKYMALMLSAVNALEQNEGTLSLKDVTVSFESLLLERTAIVFRIIRRMLFVVYAVCFVASLAVSCYLTKNGCERTKSIVFGEQ